MNQQHEYIEFLRYCMHDDMAVPRSACCIDWGGLLRFGERHAIVGVLFSGIMRLGAGDPHPDVRTLAKWGVANQFVADANKKAYHDAFVAIDTIYRRWGHRSCVLKGQGNALMYPDPYMRTPGDIDLWVVPNNGETIDDVARLCRKITPGCEVAYHHSHNDNVVGTFLELHFRPSYSENLFYNSRLQQYFIANREQQLTTVKPLPDGLGKICVPTDAFNRVFQLSHIMKHFVYGGVDIGLRHVIDYFYLLRRGCTDDEKAEFRLVARRLGMLRFARGLMYVLSHYLGLEPQYLLVKPDKWLGRFIMHCALRSGNFTREGVSDRIANALDSIWHVSRLAAWFPMAPLEHVSWILWWHFYYEKRQKRILSGHSHIAKEAER